MPCLEQTALEGDHAQLYVFSVMLQPRNVVALSSLFKWFKTQRDLQLYQLWRPVRTAFSDELKLKIEDTLWESHAGPTADEVQRYYTEGLERGRRAGRILNWILGHRASLNKAFEEFAGHKQQQRTQRDQWQSMVPAAHLWARALEHPIAGKNPALAAWLSAAEEIRRQGEAFIPHHGRESLLDPEQMWHLP